MNYIFKPRFSIICTMCWVVAGMAAVSGSWVVCVPLLVAGPMFQAAGATDE